jgi:hypothetical protein
MESDIYRQRLAALREENEYLRQAAHSFGELAERLARELREVRLQAERDQRDRRSSTWGPGTSRSGSRVREVVRQP